MSPSPRRWRGHQPIRMCVGCRRRHPASALLRFHRRPDGRVVPSSGNVRVRGRSAYLCPSHTCYQTAIRRRAFARALAGSKGLSVSVDGSTLWADLEQAMTKQVEQLRRTRSPAEIESVRGGGRLNELMSLHHKLREARKGVRHGKGPSL